MNEVKETTRRRAGYTEDGQKKDYEAKNKIARELFRRIEFDWSSQESVEFFARMNRFLNETFEESGLSERIGSMVESIVPDLIPKIDFPHVLVEAKISRDLTKLAKSLSVPVSSIESVNPDYGKALSSSILDSLQPLTSTLQDHVVKMESDISERFREIYDFSALGSSMTSWGSESAVLSAFRGMDLAIFREQEDKEILGSIRPIVEPFSGGHHIQQHLKHRDWMQQEMKEREEWVEQMMESHLEKERDDEAKEARRQQEQHRREQEQDRRYEEERKSRRRAEKISWIAVSISAIPYALLLFSAFGNPLEGAMLLWSLCWSIWVSF